MAVAANSRRNRRNTREDVRGRALDQKDAERLSDAAAAAERASAGMGTEESEPADWLFGDTLGEDHSG